MNSNKTKIFYVICALLVYTGTCTSVYHTETIQLIDAINAHNSAKSTQLLKHANINKILLQISDKELHQKIIDACVQAQVDFNKLDPATGRTILMTEAIIGNFDILQKLLQLPGLSPLISNPKDHKTLADYITIRAKHRPELNDTKKLLLNMINNYPQTRIETVGTSSSSTSSATGALPVLLSRRKIPRAIFGTYHSIKNQLLDLINQTQTKISMAIFTFTDGEIATALKQAHNRGVEVTVISDAQQTLGYTPQNNLLQDLQSAGLNILLWSSPKAAFAKMHHKFIIFQGIGNPYNKVLWNGSYNFTSAGSFYNRENVIITQDTTLIKDFENEFYHLQKASKKSLSSPESGTPGQYPASYQSSSSYSTQPKEPEIYHVGSTSESEWEEPVQKRTYYRPYYNSYRQKRFTRDYEEDSDAESYYRSRGEYYRDYPNY